MPQSDRALSANPTADPTGAPPAGLSARAGELAHLVGGELVGDASIELTGFASLDDAKPGDLTFVRSTTYADAWARSRGSAALVTRGIDVVPSAQQAVIIVDDADLAMTTILAAIEPKPSAPEPGVHASATIDPDASVDPTASIGPGCVVSAGATIGARCQLVANVFVGEHATIGPRTRLHAGAVVEHRCRVGADCVLHANVVLGADGFGYRPAPNGESLVRLPHLCSVTIEDEVEIGAGTCIDRGKLRDTHIGHGSKIDNLVQIGHSVQTGRCCIICGHASIAGSTTLGDRVTLAGRSALPDGITVGSGATIAAGSAPTNNVPAGKTYAGYPAVEASRFARNTVALRKAGEMYASIASLRKQVAELQRKSDDTETPGSGA